MALKEKPDLYRRARAKLISLSESKQSNYPKPHFYQNFDNGLTMNPYKI